MKTKFILIALSVALLVSVNGLAAAQIERLTTRQVEQEIKTGNVLVLDANPKSIYKKHHVPKAKNIHFSEFRDVLPKDKTKRIIFYCMSDMCTASHQAAELALKAGYKNVALMPSGISGWLKMELPVESIQ